MSDRPYKKYQGGKVEPNQEFGASNAAPAVAPERRGAIELPAAGTPPPIVPPRFRLRSGPGWRPRRRQPRSLKFWVIAIAAIVLFLLFVWLALSLLAMRSSILQANDRLDPRARTALSPAGSILSDPTAILVIGVDERANSDTLQVIRFDPQQQLVATLAIPRDLRVAVPGYGDTKINAAYARGGAALALQTVAAYTGLQIDHVVVLDFNGLIGLVDALGGITINNPHSIRSIFEATLVKFPAGRITLNGTEALAYSRVRKNILDPSDSDVSRGQRQQAIIQALRSKVLSPGGILRLRAVAGSINGAFATDLTFAQLFELVYVDQRASRRLRCNLGGTPAPLDGQDMLIPDGSGNRRVLGEFLGNQAVQPAASRSMFAAQCHAA
ncbi:MAG: LytR family transcriptional regulator [Thermoleophilia bacterium]|nr:LytR family transcriptional regulator [Thermoleophilia bacterium]